MSDTGVPIVNSVNKNVCATCGDAATKMCPHCGQDFCVKHSCYHQYEIKEEPLMEEDGTVHQGKRIRLIGEGWPTDLRLIKNLSDEELTERIRELQVALKEAIRQVDYIRISLAAHQYEEDYIKHSRYVAAVKRREKIAQGALKLNGRKFKVDAQAQSGIPADILSMMKAFNLTEAQARAMKILLQGAKK